MIDKRALRWEVVDAGGWEYLLPRGVRRRWLSVDVSRGATTLLLAGLCDELHVIPADRATSAEIADKLRAEDIVNVRLAVDGAFPEDVCGNGFDGFILHDLSGVLDRQTVEHTLRTGAQRVAPDGFVYAALRNRYSYTRLRRKWSEIWQRGTGAYFSVRTVRQLLGSGRETVLYPLISTGDGRVVEMVPPAGYVSAKNPSLVTENLRRWLLGRRGARHWCPGFAMVAIGDPTAHSGLGCALDTLEARGYLKTQVERGSHVKRYHVLTGGKAIVSVGDVPGRYGSHIVVLVRSPDFTARRRREGELLARLAMLPAEIARRIPRFYYETEAGGAHVFVLEEFPGITLDAPTVGLRVATRDAADFLVRLHSATRHVICLTPDRFHTILGAVFEAARSRYPVLAATFGRVEAALQKTLTNIDVPIVWMHGDFKIENIVVDEDSFRLLGVIDWELSEPEGLPLLDLWYLILYNRQIERGVDFLEVVRDLLPPCRFADQENALCAEYMRALDVPPGILPALAGALIVHHAARRMDYNPDNTETMERLRRLLDEVGGWADRATAPSPAGMTPGATRDA